MGEKILEKCENLKKELEKPEVKLENRENINDDVIVVYPLKDIDTGVDKEDIIEIKEAAENISLDYLEEYSNENTHLVFR